MANTKNIVKQFKNIKVLIIGDIMLDRYYNGSVTRISPEAPVPVVNISEITTVVGGAANVSVNVAGLGAKPFLVGVIGNDYESEVFKQELEKTGVSSKYLVVCQKRKTTVKTRIVAHQQHIVRLDQESVEPLTASQNNEIWKRINKLLPEIKIIIISDYAKGVISKNLLLKIIEASKKMKLKVIVDPKGKDYSIYKNASILTPNQREAAEACNFNENIPQLVSKAGQFLLSEVKLEALLITQGEQGMTLFQNNKRSKHLSSISRDVYDVTGAGDTVIATLAVSIAAGADFEISAELANLAAGIVIEHFGTTPIKIEELAKALEDRNLMI